MPHGIRSFYRFNKNSPNIPRIIPTIIFCVSLSLKKSADISVTRTIPLKLKSGNKITDGTLEASFVITMLMAQSERADAAESARSYPQKAVFITRGFSKHTRISAALTKE